MAKSLILANSLHPKFKSQSQIHKYLGCGYKGLVFCKNNGCLMENMDKGLTAEIADSLAENTKFNDRRF